MFSNKSCRVALAVLLSALSFSAHAYFNVNLNLAVAAPPPAPPPNVAMAPPPGYVSCYMTPGAWFEGTWIPPHQECNYPRPDGGSSLWISGYWGCIAVGPGGECGRWKWHGHRWHGPQVGYNYPHGQRYHYRHW